MLTYSKFYLIYTVVVIFFASCYAPRRYDASELKVSYDLPKNVEGNMYNINLHDDSNIRFIIFDGAVLLVEKQSPVGHIVSRKIQLSAGLHRTERFYSDGTIRSVSLQNRHDSTQVDTNYYQSGTIQSITVKAKSKEDLTSFLLNGELGTDSIQLGGDTIQIIQLDSIGNVHTQTTKAGDELLEEKEYKENKLVLHTKKTKTKVDTIFADEEIYRKNKVLTKNDIMTVVKKYGENIRQIYNKYVRKGNYYGRVLVKFTIAPNGKIVTIEPIEYQNTLPDDMIAEVIAYMANWRFAKQKSGNTTVSIPFTFSE
jgi:hypothetical protein